MTWSLELICPSACSDFCANATTCDLTVLPGTWCVENAAACASVQGPRLDTPTTSGGCRSSQETRVLVFVGGHFKECLPGSVRPGRRMRRVCMGTPVVYEQTVRPTSSACERCCATL